jgi:DNA mismatch repair protein MutH
MCQRSRKVRAVKGVAPPKDVIELMTRARALQGRRIGELAQALGVPLSDDPLRTKGRAGELVELMLGGQLSNSELPDFPKLGVELKTIPLDALGRVRESTFICAIDLRTVASESWETSRLWCKLRRVLWVPVQSADSGPVASRRLGRPLLWQPDRAEASLLQADWTELVGLIAVGGVEEVTAHRGQVLQVRPKAASGSVRATASGPEMEPIRTVPRGFYLRARFTEGVLWRLTDGLEHRTA